MRIMGLPISPERLVGKNGSKIADFGRVIQEANCDIAIFPETALTGFYPEREELYTDRSEKGGPFMLFSELAAASGSSIVAGVAESRGEQFFNSAAVFDRQGYLLGSYDKRHPFTLEREDRVITPGVQDPVFEIGNFSISIRICFDLRFPKDFHHESEKPDIVIVIANWPEVRSDHWETLLRARAIEGEVSVIGLNRSGVDRLGQKFDGSGLAFNPLGARYDNLNLTPEGLFLWDIQPREDFLTVGRTRGALNV